MKTPAWISAREAAARLDIKLATLYAYASRGLIESVPAAGGRARLYAREAVERLKTRHDARSGHTAVAAAALRFGEPTLETGVSEIRADGPYYRGHAALGLADGSASFESVCDLLWTGKLASPPWSAGTLRVALPRRPAEAAPIGVMARAVCCAALTDLSRHGASDVQEHARARRLIHWLALLVGGHAVRSFTRGSTAERLAVGHGVTLSDESLALLDRSLILCADHELNPSTFAARVTASTGADLYACLGAGLLTLSGPRHGGVSARVEAFLQQLTTPAAAVRVVRECNARGEQVPGFGQPLYPGGDPRGAALLELAERALHDKRRRAGSRKQSALSLARVRALVQAMRGAEHPGPNLDLGLVALRQALGLPRGAAASLFAVGRLAGWVAHALEQRSHPYVLRPRARYVAPAQGAR